MARCNPTYAQPLPPILSTRWLTSQARRGRSCADSLRCRDAATRLFFRTVMAMRTCLAARRRLLRFATRAARVHHLVLPSGGMGPEQRCAILSIAETYAVVAVLPDTAYYTLHTHCSITAFCYHHLHYNLCDIFSVSLTAFCRAAMALTTRPP